MGRHDRLIEQLFADEQDRVLARAFAERFGDVPGMADRIAPLLQEAARSAEQVGGGVMSPEDARNYLVSFASEGLGAPAHLVQALQDWQPDPSLLPPDTEQSPQPEAAPAPAQPAQPAAKTPARPETAAPTRDANSEARIAEIKTMMGAPHGSDAWRSYWMGEVGAKVQREYRDLIALKAAAGAETPGAPPTLAGGAPSPAHPAAALPAEPTPVV